MNPSELELLLSLLSIASPSGDEKVMADWLTHWVELNLGPAITEEVMKWIERPVYDPMRTALASAYPTTLPQFEIVRLRDCLLVIKGDAPRAAIFAHIDTCGFTVGYGEPYELISIGGPVYTDGQLVRIANRASDEIGKLVKTDKDSFKVDGLSCKPGDRLIYCAEPIITDKTVKSPYLDNRAGIWAALYVLQNCENVCVCFTTGEETGASGAIICAKYIYETFGITKALISDITWDTEHVHCGDGAAISRRDRWVPSQGFVDQLVDLARETAIKFQIEIESDGGSDGGGIERSGCPIDWAFVGAPEKLPHSATEELNLADLMAMGQLLTYFAQRL